MAVDWLDLTGRVAMVTAGSARGGIGHATALELARAGADLFVCDIDGEGAQQTACEVEALGRRCMAVQCDMGDADAIVAMFTDFDRAYDRVDILVNNCGIGTRYRPEDLPLDEWRKIVRINLEGTWVCTQEAGRRMIRAGRGGAIVSISSIAGSSALGRGNFVYSVTKAGIIQFTRELAVEWAPHGIRVNAIQPVQVRTQAMANMLDDPQLDPKTLTARFLRGIPLDRIAEPEDIARAVLFLASDGASFITGHSLPVDGGNLALNAGGSKLWPTEDVAP
ncbi:MAG: SDR family NAD(P)-dependent oxidoreductase [Thermomicrobiales bacterium]